MGGEKASGPDGFPFAFYQTFWDMLKEHIMGIFNEWFSGNIDLFSVNKAFIVLIPKKDGADRVSDFRPISLVHAIPKIMSKVLVNRLKSTLAVALTAPNLLSLRGGNCMTTSLLHSKWSIFARGVSQRG